MSHDYAGGAGDQFDPQSSQDTIRSRLHRVGAGSMENLLTAWFVATDPKTPAWVQASLGGALVYFGFPLDAVPDLLPAVGLSDDVAVLGAALAGVTVHIRPRHRRKARVTLRSWGLVPERPAT